MEQLHDFYFHYNIYTLEWNAFLREESNLYMSGLKPTREYTSFKDKDINNLIKKIKDLQTLELV